MLMETSAKKERGDLLRIDVTFSVQKAHLIMVAAEGMHTAGVIGSNNQQFSLGGILSGQSNTVVILLCPVMECFCGNGKLFPDASG